MLGVVLAVALAAGGSPQTASRKATLQLEVKPAKVAIFVDDRPVGDASQVRKVSVTPGRHTIKLVREKMSQEETITLKAGETKIWVFDFGSSSTDELKVDEPAQSISERASISHVRQKGRLTATR